MNFTALPVNVGDSFLLHCNEKYILVDGGMNKNHIITLLNKERIPDRHIHYLICTHYDIDHANGIIGILKSGKYTFDELWLPEIFGSIGYTISEKLEDILVFWRKNYHKIDELLELLNEDITNLEINNHAELQVNSFEKLNSKVLENILLNFTNRYLRYFCIYYFFGPTSINLKMINSFYKICLLLTNALHSSAYIRWFKYMDSLQHSRCPNSLYAENAVETAITIYSPEIFMKMLWLTTINKHSLVFLFEEDNSCFPNVLFTADSDLHFYSQQKILKDFSIVTAPHHGSESNSLAYSKIDGNNLIFVRSDRSQLRRPGPSYLKQAKRYCTICRNRGPKQKIVIKFSNSGTPQIYGKPCNCHSL